MDPLLLIMFGIPLGAALILSAPIVFFGRRRVKWRYWEALAFVLPFCGWMLVASLLEAYTTRTKGWGNMIEPWFIGPAIPIAALVRVIVGKKGETLCALIIQAVLFLIGALVAFLTPDLGGSLG